MLGRAWSSWPPVAGGLRKHRPMWPEQHPASGGFTPSSGALRNGGLGYFVSWGRFGGKLSPTDELAATAVCAAAGTEAAPRGAGACPWGPSPRPPPPPQDVCPVRGEGHKGGTVTTPGHPKTQLLSPRLRFRGPFAKENLETPPGDTRRTQCPALAGSGGSGRQHPWAGAR